MKRFFLLTLIVLGFSACAPSQTYEYPFQNPELSVDKRVDNLISLLTPDEKVGLMMNGSISIDRLGIPAYNWWSEACHGITAANATVFPQAIGLAASFDVAQQYEIYTAVSDEARAQWNTTDHNEFGKTKATWFAWHKGLSFWCPNINIFRDPRWGRGQETSGEDPFLAGEMGVQVVKGMQGNDPKYYKTIACAKHFGVHSGPEFNRGKFNSIPTERDMWETYMPAFKKLVTEGGVVQVMSAYNAINGEPCSTNTRLLQDILRDKWGFKGFVVSDCGAIGNLFGKRAHAKYPDAATAAAAAVKAGTDAECGTSYEGLKEALQKGYITEDEIDISLRRVLRARIMLGTFDPENLLPWKDLGVEDISSAEHTALAEKAARETMVLLKNEGVLPLSKNLKKIAVVGPNADNVTMHLGNYNGTPTEENTLSIVDAIRQAVPNTEIFYDRACELVGPIEEPDGSNGIQAPDFAKLADSVKDADVIVVVSGLSPALENEDTPVHSEGFLGGDRTKIELPDIQNELIVAMHSTGKPVVVVNCSGSAIAFGGIEENYNALIQAWYGGQAMGHAVAAVLFGDYNPAGRLPVTFYASTDQLPDFYDYNMEGRTYRYFKGEPLYAFGYGLSYTEFKYGEAKISGRKHTVKIPVTNVGDRDGEEVVQVYVKALDNPDAPIKSLKGFQRVAIGAGQTVKVAITLGNEAFEFYDETVGDLSFKPGRYQILYGSSSRECDLKVLEVVI